MKKMSFCGSEKWAIILEFLGIQIELVQIVSTHLVKKNSFNDIMSHFGMNLKQYALANIEFVTRHFEERLEVDDAAIQLSEEK